MARLCWLGLALATASLPWTLSSCSSSSNNGGPDIQFQFVTNAASIDEGDILPLVSIELSVRNNGVLANDVTVEVTDLATGSATSGTDYGVVGTQVATFLAGDGDGTVRSANFVASDDSLAEGLEEVRLMLQNPSQGTGLGNVRNMTISMVDGDQPIVSYVDQMLSTLDESASTYAIDIQLTYPVGTLLERPISVTARDSGQGTANSGADYSPITPVDFTFPTTTVAGTVGNIQISVLEDTLAEGNESVILTFNEASGFGFAPVSGNHTFIISDDDVSAASLLEVTADTGGGPAPVSHNSSVDFGTQALGTNSAGVTIAYSNLGQNPITLNTPTVTGDVDDFRFEASFTFGPAGLPSVADARSSFLVRREEDASTGVHAELDVASLVGLESVSRLELAGFPIPGAGSLDLELERMPLPWADDAQLVIDGEPLPGGPWSLLEGLTLWTGRVAGNAGSEVFLSVSPHGVRGWIQPLAGSPEKIHIQPEIGDSGPRTSIVLDSQLAALGARPGELCSGALRPPVSSEPATAALGGSPSPTVGDARIALATDFQFYNLFGSQPAATAYITSLFAAASDIYSRDTLTTLSLVYVELNTIDAASDSWTSPETPGADTIDMLDEFQAAWAPMLGGTWPAVADVAHFISGAALGGGVAYVGVLCDQNFAFGVSADFEAAINFGTFDGTPNNMNWDLIVVSHEIGHNFNAEHTHDVCPPIDNCVAGCVGSTTCSQGTIMSYCHLCPGYTANVDLRFHPRTSNAMRSHVNQSCLGSASLQLNETIEYTVRFSPEIGIGASAATFSLSHSANNVSSPFRLNFEGQATAAP